MSTYVQQSSNGICIWSGFPAIVTTDVTTLYVIGSVTAQTSTSFTIRLSANIGSMANNLAVLTAPTDETTYTLSIPAGTNLSTVTVKAWADITPGTWSSTTVAPHGLQAQGNCSVQGFEIYIQ